MTFIARHTGKSLGILIAFIVALGHISPAWAEAAQVQEPRAPLVAVFHCDYSPVSFWDWNTNKPSGFFVEIMDSIAKRGGYEVNYICKSGWPEMISAIEHGEADLGVLLRSEEREKVLLFSSPIDMTYLSFFSRSQSSIDAGIAPAGYTVGVVKGSMSYEQLKNRTGLRLQTEGSYQEGIFRLLAGKVDLFAGEDSMILKVAREAGLEDRIKKAGKPFAERERGIVVQKNNVPLLKLLNSSLSGFVGSPEYQRIYLKWYGTPAPYWTTRRVLTGSGVFLIILFGVMAFWRYWSISRMNTALRLQVAERTRVEEALRKSEGNLTRAEKIAKLGNWQWNIATNELIWSDEVYRIYGLDPLKDKPSYAVVVQTVAPECRDRFVSAVENAVQQGAPFDGEYRMIGLDGSERYTHTIGEVLRGKDGRPVTMFGIVQDITERKKAERELELFKNLLNRSGEAIFVNDPQTGRFIDVNDRACTSLGYTREELLARGVRDIEANFPDDLIWQDHVAEVRRQGSLLLEGMQKRKEGTAFPVEINVSLVALHGREYMVAIARDITDRKRSETTLRAREKQLAESQRIAHIGSWEHNLTLGQVFWSDELFRLLGLDPKTDTAGFQMFSNMVHPDDRLKLKKAIVGTVQLGKPFSIEYRLVCRDGSVRIIHARAELIQEDTGTQSILSGTAQDITERKIAEEKIRENEQFIRGILDTVDEGFIVIGRDYCILTANKAYCGQVGLSSDSVINRHCYEISHKTSRPCYDEGEECAVQQVFATGEPHSASHRHLDADGHVVYVETRAYPMKNSSGTVVSAIETVTNITEKHLLEEERLKTQKLESIGTLAGGIAHDFNNLLQGVFGYISLAMATFDEKEKSLAMLEQAEKALHQSVNLTTQLLTFSKGGKPVKKTLVLSPMIENAVKFALSGSRTRYEIKIEPGLWQVEADEGQLGQVIQNIVLNADQAMPLGGSVRISARNLSSSDALLPQELKHQETVLIEIQDSGIGIPKQYLSKIFDPYFTTKEKGSGLGLATSYSIIKNHGGLVRIQSEVGKGTVFYLYLPALTTGREERKIPATQAATRKGRVLVMDDEEMIRMVAKEMLRELGHEVVFSDKGEAAIEAYRAAQEAGTPFDVVILDLTIRGGMGGEETFRTLREIDPEVKAVVSSGYSDDAALSTYRDQGFRAFLKKPYNLMELRQTVNAQLR